jgi:hypothetical protein
LEIEQIVDVLKQCRGIALDHSQVVALKVRQVVARAEDGFSGPEDQGQRRSQLMADIGEGIALQPVQFPHPVQQLLESFIIARDLSLRALLLGDSAAFGEQENDAPAVVSNRFQRIVNNDCLFARRLPLDLNILADAFSGASPLHEGPLQFLRLPGDEPPAGFPKRLPLDVVQSNAGPLERHPVDVEHVALGIQQSDKLIHFVEDLRASFSRCVCRSSVASNVTSRT